MPSALIIDSDPHPVALHLAATGWTYTIARSAQEALVTLATVRPQVIVMELLLPDLEGFALMTLLASTTIPIVVLTTVNGSDSEQRARREGAVDFIRKPLDPATFTLRLFTAIRGGTP